MVIDGLIVKTDWMKVYHDDVGVESIVEMRKGPFFTDTKETWKYHYTSQDTRGKYDLLFRHTLSKDVLVYEP